MRIPGAGAKIARALERVLLEPRQPRFAWLEGCALAIWSIVVFFGLPLHEPWFDESEAWLIARDSTLTEIITKRLHYEGQPAGWHTLCWLANQLHISMFGTRVLCAVLAAGGIYIWLRWSPLPQLLTLLMPFTFFLQYQYAFIFRPYMLFPLTAFLLMALYARKSKMIWICGLAGVAANLSTHGAGFCAGMVVWAGWDTWKSSSGSWNDKIKPVLVPVACFVVLLALGAASAWPVADGRSSSPFVTLLGRVTGAKAPPRQVVQSIDLNSIAPSGGAAQRCPGRLSRMLAQRLKPPAGAGPGQVLLGKTLGMALVIPTALTAPISTSNILGVAFLVLLGVNLWRRRLWISLAPYLGVFLVVVLLQYGSHHLGMLWVALLASVWAVSLQGEGERTKWFWRQSLYAVLLVIVLLQVGWTAYAVKTDIREPYSGDKAEAEFLRQLPAGSKVAGVDTGSIAVNVYLPAIPYFNQDRSYWVNNRENDSDAGMEHHILQALAQKPDEVVTGARIAEHPVDNQWFCLTPPGSRQVSGDLLLRRWGYVPTHEFCGKHVFRNATEFEDCSVIYEPKTSQTQPGS